MKDSLTEAGQALDRALVAAEAEIRGLGLDVRATVEVDRRLQLRWDRDPADPAVWGLWVGRVRVYDASLDLKIAAAEVLARGWLMVSLEREVTRLTERIQEATASLQKWLAEVRSV